MILVLDIFKDIDEYRDEFRPNSLPKPEVCAVCGLSATLAYNGTYSRGVVVAVSFAFCEIRIQRLRCRACRVTFSLLPCFLLPRRQYEASIVAELSLTYIQGASSYRRTVRNAADDPESNRPAHNTLWYWLSFWGCAEWSTEVLQRLLTHIARCFPQWNATSQLSRPDDIDESKYRSDERRDLLCRALNLLQSATALWRLAAHQATATSWPNAVVALAVWYFSDYSLPLTRAP